MEENVTAGQLFLQGIKFSPLSYYTEVPYCFTYYRRYTIQTQPFYISRRKKSTYPPQSVFVCLYDLIRIMFCNNTQQMIFVTEKRCGFCAVKLTFTISFTLNEYLWLETQSLSTKPDILGNLLKFNISPITIHTKSAIESYPKPAQSKSQVHIKYLLRFIFHCPVFKAASSTCMISCAHNYYFVPSYQLFLDLITPTYILSVLDR
jgi:hypothetical protein